MVSLSGETPDLVFESLGARLERGIADRRGRSATSRHRARQEVLRPGAVEDPAELLAQGLDPLAGELEDRDLDAADAPWFLHGVFD